MTATCKRVWQKKSLFIVLMAYLAICLIAALQGLLGALKTYETGGLLYKDYNNFVIFKYSFFHLLHGEDIYRLFPGDHWDLYKYSPTFSLLFGAIAWLPDYLGLPVWDLMNALCLFTAIKWLPGLDDRKKSWLLLFCLPELLGSIQNTQSNGLMAGLLIMALALAERSKYALSTLCIVLSVYIKIYGALAFVLYLFYPGKFRIAAWTLVWMLLLTALPLAVINTHQLIFLYRSWLHLLENDRSASIGLSVMGMMGSWFKLAPPKGLVAGIGLLLFALPLMLVKQYREYRFRLLMLASVLLWIVLFNHKAESPTYVIAMSGVGIWYFSQAPTRVTTILLLFTFIGTSLSVSDLVPHYLKQHYVVPYGLKAFMPLIIWCRILYDLGASHLKSVREPVPSVHAGWNNGETDLNSSA